jgi:hypothetical protein
MKRDDLLKALLNASLLEESHTQQVSNFLINEFNWEGVDHDKAAVVKDLLNTIRKQTMEHEIKLDELVGIARGSDQDEF